MWVPEVCIIQEPRRGTHVHEEQSRSTKEGVRRVANGAGPGIILYYVGTQPSRILTPMLKMLETPCASKGYST